MVFLNDFWSGRTILPKFPVTENLFSKCGIYLFFLKCFLPHSSTFILVATRNLSISIQEASYSLISFPHHNRRGWRCFPWARRDPGVFVSFRASHGCSASSLSRRLGNPATRIRTAMWISFPVSLPWERGVHEGRLLGDSLSHSLAFLSWDRWLQPCGAVRDEWRRRVQLHQRQLHWREYGAGCRLRARLRHLRSVPPCHRMIVEMLLELVRSKPVMSLLQTTKSLIFARRVTYYLLSVLRVA